MLRTFRPTDRPKASFIGIFRENNMSFQVRIRTDAEWAKLGYVTEWLNDCEKGFAFRHNKPGNNHYHIYLFGLQRNPDAMRKYLGRYLPSKECYSVGTTAGKKKEPIVDMKAYCYASAPDSNPEEVWMKGFTEGEKEAFHRYVEDYYHKPEKEYPIVVTPEDAKGLPLVVFKTDRVWERLSANADDYRDLTVKAIKAKLAAEWLNAGRAIMRNADAHRYALSLFYLNKHRDGPVPDDALLGEFE